MNLSYALRPKTLSEFIGQEHLVGKDQRVQVELLEGLQDLRHAAFFLVGVGAGGAQDGAALEDDLLDGFRLEGGGVGLDHALPAAAQAEALGSVGGRVQDDPADGGIEAGAVAAAGQDADAFLGHEVLLVRSFR